jgi:hypothetical protein
VGSSFMISSFGGTIVATAGAFFFHKRFARLPIFELFEDVSDDQPCQQKDVIWTSGLLNRK